MSSIIEGYNYDIFISYRQKDNKYDGWVTEFVDKLRKELEATFKEDILIYFDENPHDGLLETHNVEKSLEGKLRCLVFIPVISQTYCDPKSFAWQNEFCAFNKLAKEDHFGRDIRLPGGNVASRILPVKINDLDPEDEDLLENELGGVLRAVEFIYKEPGVNRPLTPDDDEKKNLNKTKYRNQINKVANAVKEIIKGLKFPGEKTQTERTKVTETETGRRKIPKLSGASSAIGKSIAVLPFEQWSSDEEFSHLGDAIANEINTQLVKIKDFRVISFISCSRFRGSDRPSITEMGEALGASIIVVGSVERQDQDVSIQVQAIRVSSDDHLWADDYKDKWTNIYKIRTNIAVSIAKELKIALQPEELDQIKNVDSENTEAYNLYLRGNFWMQQLSYENIRKAIEDYQQAIALDSAYAQPYAGLARAYFELTIWDVREPDSAFIPVAKKWALKALELNENLGEPHYIFGAISYMHDWDWKAAERHLKTGMERNPNCVWGRFYYSYLSFLMRHFEEAIFISEQTLKLDPLDPYAYIELGCPLYYAGQKERAFGLIKKSLELHPDFWNAKRGLVFMYIEKGINFQFVLDYCQEQLEPYNYDYVKVPAFRLGDVGYFMAQIGHQDEALRILDELKRRVDAGEEDTLYMWMGYISYWLDNTETAIDYFEKSYEAREDFMYLINILPEFNDEELRSNPRFQAIITKLGFEI